MEVREACAAYQVEPAYKQTEVGDFPNDWEVISLAELFKFKNGLNKAKEFFGYGTPIVNYMDVFKRTHLSAHDIAGRVDVNTREISAYEVRQGDVFFTRTSETAEEIGLASVIDSVDENTVFSGFILRARPTDQTLDTKFKGYCFSANYFRQQVISRASYTTRALTNGRSLSAAFLARPPLAEQKAIASALSDADALIESLEELLAKKRKIKQGAMQELLTGHRRLPGFDERWSNVLLSELGKFTKGSGVTREQSRSGSLPCIRYGEIYTVHHDHVHDFYSWISSDVAATATRLKNGDLLFAGSGETREEIGKCVAFLSDAEAYAGGDIVILRPEGCDSRFLGYALNTAAVISQKASLGQGDAVVHISATALGSIALRLPEKEEQTAIATVLADMDADIAALEAKLAKARDLKQGMMQQLLTGRIRLV